MPISVTVFECDGRHDEAVTVARSTNSKADMLPLSLACSFSRSLFPAFTVPLALSSSFSLSCPFFLRHLILPHSHRCFYRHFSHFMRLDDTNSCRGFKKQNLPSLYGKMDSETREKVRYFSDACFFLFIAIFVLEFCTAFSKLHIIMISTLEFNFLKSRTKLN